MIAGAMLLVVVLVYLKLHETELVFAAGVCTRYDQLELLMPVLKQVAGVPQVEPVAAVSPAAMTVPPAMP